MRRFLTREEVAELFGVSVVTVDTSPAFREALLAAEVIGHDGADGADGAADLWAMSLRELATLWHVHVDTLSKWMPAGLGAAVVDRRERGELVLDLRLAMRWKLAREGALNQVVLDDFAACAARELPAVHALSALPLLAAAAPQRERRRKRAARAARRKS